MNCFPRRTAPITDLWHKPTGDGAEGEQGRFDGDADITEVGVGEHGTRCRRAEGDDDGAIVQVSLDDVRQDAHL